MEYVALVMAIIAGVAGVIAAAASAALKVSNKDKADFKKKLEDQIEERRQEKLSFNDQMLRREEIINNMKSELAKAEEDLAKASTPAAVRERLSKLFP